MNDNRVILTVRTKKEGRGYNFRVAPLIEDVMSIDQRADLLDEIAAEITKMASMLRKAAKRGAAYGGTLPVHD